MENHDESGFTLIELVMVIVILGILAAVATPKFTSLVEEADASAVKGIAGGLASAAATNWALCKSSSAACISISNCTDVANLLTETLPTNMTIASQAIAAGATVSCTLTGGSSKTATFTATKG